MKEMCPDYLKGNSNKYPKQFQQSYTIHEYHQNENGTFEFKAQFQISTNVCFYPRAGVLKISPQFTNGHLEHDQHLKKPTLDTRSGLTIRQTRQTAKGLQRKRAYMDLK